MKMELEVDGTNSLPEKGESVVIPFINYVFSNDFNTLAKLHDKSYTIHIIAS